jgi:acyl dehydratase
LGSTVAVMNGIGRVQPASRSSGVPDGEAIMLYLEDFAPGQNYASGRARVDAAAIKAFAAQFDPQTFHLDEEAARDTFFGGLAASGWHTAALTMKLLVESSFRPAGGIIGTRTEELKWPRPVRPGDELHVEAEILEVRPSASRPGQGFVKCRSTTVNQNGEPVQILVINLLVQSRSKGR